jgi:hypothetical protein
MAAEKQTVEERLSFLTGEVHALLLFCQVMARTHPNPLAVVVGLAAIEQKGLAQIEGSLVPDATVTGYQFAMNELKKLAKAASGT